MAPKRLRLATRPSFLLGLFVGGLLCLMYDQIALAAIGATPSAPLVRVAEPEAAPVHPPEAGSYHAIIVPAGGQGADGPPPHVIARLERAAVLYHEAPVGPPPLPRHRPRA